MSRPSGLVGEGFHGPNLAYVLEMYEDFRADPASVDESTRDFFGRWSPPADEAEGEGPGDGPGFSGEARRAGLP